MGVGRAWGGGSQVGVLPHGFGGHLLQRIGVDISPEADRKDGNQRILQLERAFNRRRGAAVLGVLLAVAQYDSDAHVGCGWGLPGTGSRQGAPSEGESTLKSTLMANSSRVHRRMGGFQ